MAKAAKVEQKGIEIMPLNIQKVSIEIENIPGSSLIVHKFSEKSMRQMEEKQQMATKTKKHDLRNPTAEFEAAKHIVDGKDCFPAVAFKIAMVRAGQMCGIPMTESRQLFFVLNVDGGEFIPIISEPATMRTDTVRIASGATDLRYRPEYVNWRMFVGLEFDSSNITLEQVINLLNRAGAFVGIGENRPMGKSSTGNHGRFRVKVE